MKIILSVLALMTTSAAFAAPTFEGALKEATSVKASAADSCLDQYQANVLLNQKTGVAIAIGALGMQELAQKGDNAGASAIEAKLKALVLSTGQINVDFANACVTK